jgi:swainsonine biosynthesis dioxygenase SwnH1/2
MTVRALLKPLDPSFVPSVSLTKLPATSLTADIVAALDRDGGVILTNYVSKQDVNNIQEELRPYQTKDEAFKDAPVNAALEIVSSSTHLIHGLVGKSPTMAKVCESETLENVRNEILTERFHPVYENGEAEDFVIRPILSISGAFNIGYGAPRQKLHRDDFPHAVRHDRTFDLSKEMQVVCFVAGTKTTRENGATLFIPGSHRWPDERTGELEEVCFVGKSFPMCG